MQERFFAHCTASEYAAQGRGYAYPWPKRFRCPNCGVRSRLRRHGFYSRYYLGLEYQGRIEIRRYYCKACGQTVSELPWFCQGRFQYAPWSILWLIAETGRRSMEAVARSARDAGLECMTRQLLNFYRRRLADNVHLLELALRDATGAAVLSSDEDIKKRAVAALSHNILGADAAMHFWTVHCGRQAKTVLNPRQ